MNFKKVIILMGIFGVGMAIGGYLFRDVQPRSFLAINDCKGTCLSFNELMGLIGSAGMQKLPDFVPFVVKETDKTVVIEPPIKEAPIHYVIVPKKDIRDAADISEADASYLMDAYAVIRELIKEKNLRQYKVYTNGPGYQLVNYLHFHLLAME